MRQEHARREVFEAGVSDVDAIGSLERACTLEAYARKEGMCSGMIRGDNREELGSVG
jgi:hypothetical protein